MKPIKFTDAELEQVRFAVAGAAAAAPDNLRLRTALAKLDGPAAARQLQIEIVRGDGGLELLFAGLARRWTPVHAGVCRQAKWRMGAADRVVVKVDGAEVDPATLGNNEPL